ncbi:MAG: hypothetical protein ABSG98_04415 [Anaerolineales bacterium]
MSATATARRIGPRLDYVVILLVVVAAAVLRYQGWRGNLLNSFDLLPYHVGAFRFFQTGQVEVHGDKSSYFSFQPPGTFFLMLPGTLLLGDERLRELPGEFLQNLATLVFLYLIVRATLNRGIALASVVGVGLSQLGYLGVWPIGHPAYYLGALYFLMLWVRDKKSWALPVALGITAFGLYVQLSIVVTVFIYPVLWLLFRPPVRIRGLVLAAAVSLLLWFPYLRFETTRDFADIRSQLLLQSLAPPQGTTSSSPPLCYASVLGRSDTWEGSYRDLGLNDQGAKYWIDPGTGLRAQLEYHTCVIFTNLDRNFDSLFFLFGYNQLANSILWTLSAMGLVILLAAALGGTLWGRKVLEPAWEIPPWGAVVAAAVGGIVLWILLGPGIWETCCSVHHRLSFPLLGLLSQARSFFPAFWVSLTLGLPLSRRWREIDPRRATVLSLGIMIPLGILLYVAEPNTALRFWWIWPAEVLTLIVTAEALGLLFPFRKQASLVLMGAAILAIFPLHFDATKIVNWRSEGYGGTDSGQLATVDYLVGRARASGKTSLTVGYDIDTYDFTYFYSVMHDPLLRRGAWFDFLLQSRGGIQNLNQTVGGLSDQDQYRVFQLQPGQLPPAPPWPGFRKVAVFGLFAVYARS